MTKPITAFGFNGMNNLVRPPAYLLDDNRRITPRYVLNADVLDGGAVKGRGGYVLVKTLAGVHSLWAESVMLAVAGGVLYQVEGVTATPLVTVPGPSAPLSYEEVNNRVYISNSYWQAIYDVQAGEIMTWGLSLPPPPNITMVAGDLPPGRYSIAYTRVDGDRISGNGPIRQVEWEGFTQGIQLDNLEADMVAWITQPNGGKLFLAEVNVYDQIGGQGPTIRPLETQGVLPPPGFTHFKQAHGRMWGVSGKNLYFSEPGQYEWFRRGGYLPFLEDLVMVVPYNGGIYVHSRTSSWNLDGTDPAKMTLKRVGDGAIPGTLTYASVPAGIAGGAATSAIFAKISKMPTPMWMSPAGVIVGTHGGNLANLTSSQLAISARQRGAALTRGLDGIPQILISQVGLSGDSDEELQQIFARNGKLFD